jgi:four helix bundle protein
MEKINYSFSFEDLRLFQKTLDLINFIYKVIATFPDSEKDNISNKLINSAQSIAINIAEGSGEQKFQYIASLKIAKIAIKQCIVYMLIAKKQNFIDEFTEEEMRDKLVEISKMISGLIRSLKNPDQNKQKELQINNSNNINLASENNFNYENFKSNGIT